MLKKQILILGLLSLSATHYTRSENKSVIHPIRIPITDAVLSRIFQQTKELEIPGTAEASWKGETESNTHCSFNNMLNSMSYIVNFKQKRPVKLKEALDRSVRFHNAETDRYMKCEIYYIDKKIPLSQRLFSKSPFNTIEKIICAGYVPKHIFEEASTKAAANTQETPADK